ncbi:hypothetical protein [Corynebacterium urogenitale]
MGGDRIDGVKVLWISQGRAARDETAFRHALATAHRLREAGERMTDAKIIDAYERAYNIAQAVGADLRQPEMPSQRDRQTMARRVRGYVLSNNRGAGSSSFSGSTGGVGMRERKALATMGRKGGQKAAERWKDRDSEYAQNQLEKLAKTQKRRKFEGKSNRQKVAHFMTSYWMETDSLPSWGEIQSETGLSRATVARHMSALKNQGELPG